MIRGGAGKALVFKSYGWNQKRFTFFLRGNKLKQEIKSFAAIV